MEKGIILVGEAAQAYVQYKYVELFVTAGVLAILFVAMAFIAYRVIRNK